MADKIDRQMTHRGAARSVTGLAAMLAHEIKNPLSGIRGAAQLLELSASRRGPRADPPDHRRDRPHRLAGRPHGGVLRRAADRALSGQHPRRARPCEGARQERLCQRHQDRRGLRSVTAAGLCQPRPAGPGVPQPGEERRRSDRPATRTARSCCRPPSGRASACPCRARRTACRCRSNSASTTTAPASRKTSCRSCSTPSSPPSPTARGSAWRWSPRSSAIMAASSNAIRRRAARRFRILMPAWKELPLAADDDDEGDQQMSVRGNILVADDDAAIRTVLNQALSRVGHEVRVTSNAATLWRWVAAGEGDLVITDVVMPDENAFDMLPRIKKARPELPVIVMSAQNTFMTAIRASETRRLRIPAEAVRPQRAAQHRQPGAGRAAGGRRSMRAATNSRRRCRWSAARRRCRTSTACSRA